MKYAPIIALSLLSSCRFLLSETFSVVSWTPAEKAVEEKSIEKVSVTFSTDAKKTSVEEAFTLTIDGVEIPGIYQWRSSRNLEYKLFNSVDKGSIYVLKVSASAEDRSGNSLKRDFIHIFSTKKTEKKPKLLSYEPKAYTDIDNRYQNIVLRFDKTMNPSSIRAHFNISPHVSGYFTWDKMARVFNFHPATPYEWQKKYSITLSADCEDDDRWKTGIEHSWSFHTGTDQRAPTILKVSNEAQTQSILRDKKEDDEFTVTQSWEKDWNILIRFSEAMDRDSVESAIKIEPEASFKTSWTSAEGGDELLLSWNEFLKYDTIYSIKLSDSLRDVQGNRLTEAHIFNFQSNGSASKPPRLMKLVYVKEAKTNPLQESVLYDRNKAADTKLEFRFSDEDEKADGSPLRVYFDFYFDLAEGAYIDPFSFMDNFAILPQKSSLTFTPVLIIARHSAAIPNYKGRPALSTDYILLRLFGDISDSTTAEGMVDFKIYSDFQDTLGNRISGEWYWQIYDKDK